MDLRTIARRCVPVLATAFIITFSSAAANAQLLTSDEAKCVDQLNKQARKVALTQFKQIVKCARDYTRDRLDPGETLEACVADQTGKLTKAFAKTQTLADKFCVPAPPYGFVSVADVNDAAIGAVTRLVKEVFGEDLDAAFVLEADDPDGSRCQQTALKSLQKLADTRAKVFLSCKKAGFKVGSITSEDDLITCIDEVELSAEDGKVARSQVRIASTLITRCLTLPNYTDLFAGDCNDAQDVAECIGERSACANCLQFQGADGLLNANCELTDNDLADFSCISAIADECAGENGGNNCDVNATCTDQEFGFDCTCDAGYVGDGVTCVDADECAGEGGGNNCDANATCSNTVGSFTCSCNSGYSGDGVTCTDDDECAGEGGGNNCDGNATCTNEPGGFSCACNAGFIGDGVSCNDANECLGEGGGNNCDGNATCTNTFGSFTCACNAGYNGNGVVCVDDNECIGEGSGNNCDANATCSNLPGTFSCACNAGFLGDGVTCVDANECIGEGGGNNCSANATCLNTVGSFNCACNAGYSGDGVTCIDDNECIGEGSGNNCSTNAECTNTPGSFSCACRDGFSGNPVGGACNPITVVITSPAHGTFTTAGSVTVTGTVTTDNLGDASLTVAGSPVAIGGGGSFSTSVTLNTADIFNGITAEVTQVSTGFTVRDRVQVIAGPSLASGANAPQDVALRIQDTGFNALEPVLESLVPLDINDLLPVGTVVISNLCVTDSFLGCLASIDRATVTAASISGFALDIDSQTNFVDGNIDINNLFIDMFIELTISGIGTSCDSFAISAALTQIDADYELQPDPGDNTIIDVNQKPGTLTVNFSSFNDNVDCGGIGFVTFLVNLAKGNVQSLVQSNLISFLDDPDGAGSQDSVVAQAIEDALGGIELTGPIGDGFGVNLTTPLFNIPEDTNGITLGAGSIITPQNPDPQAPSFAATLVVPSTFPQAQFTSTNTPLGVQYDMGIGLSETTFNQILAAIAESGTLNTEITELDLGGGPQPITAGTLALLLPEFSQLDPATALTLKISPTVAPAVTGNVGSAGEIAEMVIPHLLLEVVSGPGGSTSHGSIAIDVVAALDLVANPSGLVPTLSLPGPGDTTITLLDNPLGLDQAQVNALFQAFIPLFFDQFASFFQPFPLPEFFGLTPDPIEVSRIGDFFGIFLDVQ